MGIARLHTVYNASSKRITVRVPGVPDYIVESRENKVVDQRVPETTSVRAGITIFRDYDGHQNKRFYIRDDGDYNLCFFDWSFSADSQSYPLHIIKAWWDIEPTRQKNFNLYVDDNESFFQIGNGEKWLGYYPNNENGSVSHSIYNFYSKTNGGYEVDAEDT
jgi:hypothetical protein